MEETVSILKKMKLSGMAEELIKQEEDPNSGLRSFEERINQIVFAEWNLRSTKRINRMIKRAHLRYPEASLDETIYEEGRKLDTVTIERLADCNWIKEGKNLLITGLTGAGKSYIANALGICAIQKYYSVFYSKTNLLLQELVIAEAEQKLIDRIKELQKVDLIILDDFGLMDLDINRCRNLFELIDSREGRKSMIVISQYPVKSWFDLFGDSTFADACLDRLINKAYRLDFQGKNMRNPE